MEETYTYGGVGGRVSKRDLAITVNGSTGETFTQSWGYTELGAVASVGYPECTFTRCTADGAGISRTVSSGYVRGYLTSVTGYAGSITYHPSGLVDTINHKNGVVVSQGADPNGMARPASITARKGAATLWSTGTYRYDGAGSVTDIGASWFTYDLVSRLTAGAVSTDELGGGVLKQQSYAYDAFGNIQEIVGTPGRTTPTDSATNRLTGTAVYDAAGNLTSWNGNEYEYDAFNMMTRMRSGSEDWLYVYTADDERVWMYDRTASPVFHRYTLRDLSGKVLREYTSMGDFWTVAEDYVYRGTALLAAETPAGQRFFHLDHLGTPRLITDAIGQQTAYHVYFPFGEEATSPSQDQERMKFTSHERDLVDISGNNLDYMHARFHSPISGRFLSADPVPPITRAVLVPQQWNLYAYAAANPVRYVDPEGFTIELPDDYEDELSLIQEALRQAGATQLANALKVINVNGVNQLSAVAKEFTHSANSTANLIAGLINDNANSISLTVTSKPVGQGGATTRELSDNRTETTINPAEVRQTLLFAEPLSGPLAGLQVLGHATPGPALVHEFGHSKALFQGFSGAVFFGKEKTKNFTEAIRYENQHRLMLRGPENFRRIGHNAWEPQ